MGNPAAGHAIGLSAEHALSVRQPGEDALAILDRVCQKYQGKDAEFESEDPDRLGHIHPSYKNYTDPHPQAALGMLMVEAFAPNGLADLPSYVAMLEDADAESESAVVSEAAYIKWNQEVETQFLSRYHLLG
jgi:hypothetical protein